MKTSGTLFIALLIYLFGVATGGFLESQKIVVPLTSPTPSLVATSSALPLGKNREKAQVTQVIDGDTVKLSDGRTLRYIGIDTPESVDPRKPVQCFAKEASEKNKELVLNKEIEMEKDVSETDRYGRLLRYVYVQVGERDVMINEELVREGFAYATSYPPDIFYQSTLEQKEKEAKETGRGLWKSCIAEVQHAF